MRLSKLHGVCWICLLMYCYTFSFLKKYIYFSGIVRYKNNVLNHIRLKVIANHFAPMSYLTLSVFNILGD